jgi:hypothetical protein
LGAGGFENEYPGNLVHNFNSKEIQSAGKPFLSEFGYLPLMGSSLI